MDNETREQIKGALRTLEVARVEAGEANREAIEARKRAAWAETQAGYAESSICRAIEALRGLL